MTIEDEDWIAPALNILEKLHHKYSSVVRSKYYRREVGCNVECLVRDVFVHIEKAVLVSAEVVLLYEWVQVDQRILGRLHFI